MPPPSTILYVEIAVAVLLLALLVVRPAITRSSEGKILAAVALFVAPALAAYAGVSEHLDRSKTTRYCLSCHVMADHGKSMRVDEPEFLAAMHFQDNLVPQERACYSCHSDYGWSGDLRAKARGFKHVMKTYFGTVPDTIRISRRYKSTECLRCHLGSRSFEETITHLDGSAPMADIKSGKASCISSGCHDVVHEVGELDQMVFWDPLNPTVEEAPVARTQSAGPVGPSKGDSAAIGPKSGPE